VKFWFNKSFLLASNEKAEAITMGFTYDNCSVCKEPDVSEAFRTCDLCQEVACLSCRTVRCALCDCEHEDKAFSNYYYDEYDCQPEGISTKEHQLSFWQPGSKCSDCKCKNHVCIQTVMCDDCLNGVKASDEKVIQEIVVRSKLTVEQMAERLEVDLKAVRACLDTPPYKTPQWDCCLCLRTLDCDEPRANAKQAETNGILGAPGPVCAGCMVEKGVWSGTKCLIPDLAKVVRDYIVGDDDAEPPTKKRKVTRVIEKTRV